jgi:hypothetical protein
MIRHLLEQYNEHQILRSWSNRSRLSRRQAMAQIRALDEVKTEE